MYINQATVVAVPLSLWSAAPPSLPLPLPSTPLLFTLYPSPIDVALSTLISIVIHPPQLGEKMIKPGGGATPFSLRDRSEAGAPKGRRGLSNLRLPILVVFAHNATVLQIISKTTLQSQCGVIVCPTLLFSTMLGLYSSCCTLALCSFSSPYQPF